MSLAIGLDSAVGVCALLASGGVACWGSGSWGELGNGKFYTSGHGGSAVPVRVRAVSGTGALTGVSRVVSDGYGYCAVLHTGGVDCWGVGDWGQLGNGITYTEPHPGSALPVQVVGIGGTGTLSGVTDVVSTNDGGGNGGYCALLNAGGVACWGFGRGGELGNGVFYTSATNGSAVPVQVQGVGGSGTLSGVRTLVSDAGSGGYCALLTGGGVDCWGHGYSGELGNGTFYTTSTIGSAVPVQVKGVGQSTSPLGGVINLVADSLGYCAVLAGGRVVCWGNGYDGELGDGKFYTKGHNGSAVPVKVKAPGGSGTLSGVDRIVRGGYSYCAVLADGGLNCWGYGYYGNLGDGTYYTGVNPGSAIPVKVT